MVVGIGGLGCGGVYVVVAGGSGGGGCGDRRLWSMVLVHVVGRWRYWG